MALRLFEAIVSQFETGSSRKGEGQKGLEAEKMLGIGCVALSLDPAFSAG